MQPDCTSTLCAHGITSLIVTGVTTEVCVHTTVREANDRGYECLVLSDCVGSYFPEFQRIALEMISAQGGIFGWVAPSSAYLAALRTSSGEVVTDRPFAVLGLLGAVMSLINRPWAKPQQSALRLPWWTNGDTNAAFGLGFNMLVNVLVLSSLSIGVIGIASHDVYTRSCRHWASSCSSATSTTRSSPGASPGARTATRSRQCRTGRACRTCSSSSS